MRLRTFTAYDMPSAMKLVREALGDDAIILSTKELPHARSVAVTAAIEEEADEFISPAHDSVATSDIRFGVQEILRYHSMPDLFVAKCLQTLGEENLASILSHKRINTTDDSKYFIRQALEYVLTKMYEYAPLPLDMNSFKCMLIGPSGVGKTLAIAKLATTLVMAGKPISLLTTDTNRAGGIEQLKVFTDILHVPLHVVKDAKSLGKQLKSLPENRITLIDTAGCNAFAEAEMQALEAFITKGIEPILTLPASGDSFEMMDIVEQFARFPIKRLMVTRCDMARRFGGALTAALSHKLALCHVASSASVADPLKVASPKLIAQWLLRYQLQTS